MSHAVIYIIIIIMDMHILFIATARKYRILGHNYFQL